MLAWKGYPKIVCTASRRQTLNRVLSKQWYSNSLCSTHSKVPAAGADIVGTPQARTPIPGSADLMDRLKKAVAAHKAQSGGVHLPVDAIKVTSKTAKFSEKPHTFNQKVVATTEKVTNKSPASSTNTLSTPRPETQPVTQPATQTATQPEPKASQVVTPVSRPVAVPIMPPATPPTTQTSTVPVLQSAPASPVSALPPTAETAPINGTITTTKDATKRTDPPQLAAPAVTPTSIQHTTAEPTGTSLPILAPDAQSSSQQLNPQVDRKIIKRTHIWTTALIELLREATAATSEPRDWKQIASQLETKFLELNLNEGPTARQCKQKYYAYIRENPHKWDKRNKEEMPDKMAVREKNSLQLSQREASKAIQHMSVSEHEVLEAHATDTSTMLDSVPEIGPMPEFGIPLSRTAQHTREMILASTITIPTSDSASTPTTAVIPTRAKRTRTSHPSTSVTPVSTTPTDAAETSSSTTHTSPTTTTTTTTSTSAIVPTSITPTTPTTNVNKSTLGGKMVFTAEQDAQILKRVAELGIKSRGVWKTLSQELGMPSIRTRYYVLMSGASNLTYFTKEMDDVLVQIKLNSKAKGRALWEEVAKQVGHGVTSFQCSKRWCSYLRHFTAGVQCSKHTWTEDEVARLVEYAERFLPGTIPWNDFARSLNVTWGNCNDKWTSIRQSKMKRGRYTPEEEAYIDKRVREWGDTRHNKGLYVALEQELNRPAWHIRARWVYSINRRKAAEAEKNK